ncbi:hypothetical protein [Agromyces larvae]|uniref:Hydrolytic protein n=1 Tax=Agromyces larvae TaxID=2929802 RepID=A0ABY4BX78_9MICO|nr:hypothetical protein [Agromyces larvae]UOE43827.1 hypothetical protein MTO99_16910 [Agromyces larvae]
MATTATMAPANASVTPGTPTTLTLTVLNDTLLVESFELTPVGPVAGWARIEPAVLTIYPGKSETATVTVLAPRAPESIVGEVALGVRARAVEQPDIEATGETLLSVLPFVETDAELLPRIAHGRGRKRVRIAVDNRGNQPLVAAITGTADDRLGLSTPTPDIQVDPGHTEFVDVDLRPRGHVWRGEAVSHQYTVSVAPEAPRGPMPGVPAPAAPPVEQVPIVLPGTYLQERVFPKWLWKLLLALLLLLLLLLLLWFTVLKPAIESAARDAVAEPLAQASEQAESAAQQADQAAQSANEALEAVGKTPEPVQPVATTKTDPVDIRFELTDAPGGGTTESSRWLVPPNAVLQVTDVVISNPRGDFGTLTIENADVLAPIFTSGLENFRDIDFHFVTPVRLATGDELFSTLTCTQLAPPVGGQPVTTACSVSILITAELVTTTG